MIFFIIEGTLKHIVVAAQSLNQVQFFVTPQTVAQEAPLSTEFCQQEYQNELPLSPPGDLLDPEIEPLSANSPALQADSLRLSHWGSPKFQGTSLANLPYNKYHWGTSLWPSG